MAYLANQGETGGHVQAVSGNKSDLYELMGDENVLLSLGNKTNIQNTGSKPKKPAISQKQADENKRQQLSKILEEQQKKFKEKEKKMQANQKNAATSSGNAAVLQGNQMKGATAEPKLMQNGEVWRPGME